jgi:hypothetical protein
MKNRNMTERNWMNAVTFAEAGEWETAIAMTPLPSKRKWAQFFEQVFMAVAFAEEGLHEEALILAGAKTQAPKRIKSFLDSIGLQNVRMTYGILQEGAAC